MKYYWRLARGTGTLNKHRRCFMGRFKRGMPVSRYDFISDDESRMRDKVNVLTLTQWVVLF